MLLCDLQERVGGDRGATYSRAHVCQLVHRRVCLESSARCQDVSIRV